MLKPDSRNSDASTNIRTVFDLKVEEWSLDRIKPYERNARKIPEAAVNKVAMSLEAYGWRQPIVVDCNGVIVVGHCRRLAALQLGWSTAPVHLAEDLTPEQIMAYRLMDNRSHQETAWDNEILVLELQSLKALDVDLKLTGFDPFESNGLLTMKTVEGRTNADSVPGPRADPTSVAGDVWILGEHRLACGDSTITADVDKLLAGSTAQLCFTDPPYNVDYDPEARPNGPCSAERKARPLGKICNDKKSPEEFRAFLDLVYGNIDLALEPGRAIYICHADTEGHHFRNAFIAQPWKLQSCIIWKKTVLVFGRADYHWMHEPILYGWKDGSAHVYHGDRKQTTIWEFATDHFNKGKSDTKGYVHPTQKPVALIEQAINNSTVAGEIVFDPFGGSGSTLIACEKTGRRARLLEVDPKYVDVIIRRWEAFTGKTARLENDGRTFGELFVERGSVAA